MLNIFEKRVQLRGGFKVGTSSKPKSSTFNGTVTHDGVVTSTGASTNLVWDKTTSKLTNGTGVVPVYLPVTVAAVITAAGAIPVTSSFARLNPATDPVAYTVAAGTIVGQILNIVSIAATNQSNVTVLGLSGSTDGAVQVAAAGFNRIVLSTVADSVTLMWNGTAWIVVFLAGATAAIATVSS